MDILNDPKKNIHQEINSQGTRLHLVLMQPGMEQPSILNRVLHPIGEAVRRFGTWLKTHNHRKLTSEEESGPTFIIML